MMRALCSGAEATRGTLGALLAALETGYGVGSGVTTVVVE